MIYTCPDIDPEKEKEVSQRKPKGAIGMRKVGRKRVLFAPGMVKDVHDVNLRGRQRGYANRLHQWLQNSSATERETLAAMVGTSTAMLEHYALGRRNPSAERGVEIEQATKLLSASTKGRLQVVLRTDIVSACQQCEFAKRCIGADRVAAGSFPVLGNDGPILHGSDSEGGEVD